MSLVCLYFYQFFPPKMTNGAACLRFFRTKCANASKNFARYFRKVASYLCPVIVDKGIKLGYSTFYNTTGYFNLTGETAPQSYYTTIYWIPKTISIS